MDDVRTGIGRHPVAQVCDRFADLLDGLGQPAMWSASDGDIADIVKAAEQVARRAVAVQATAVAEAQRRELPREAAATGATAWLSGLLGAKPQHAHRLSRLATGLGRVPATAAALGAGRIDADQAQVIATAVGGLPGEVGTELRGKAEAYLLEQAAIHHAGILAGLAEAKLAEQLAKDEARAERARNRLSADHNHRGRITVRGDFDAEAWATVAAALDPFTKPAPAHDTDGTDGTAQRDPRSYGQRLADGLVELARRALAAGTLPTRGGHRPQVVVTIDHDRLAGAAGTGLLDTGQPLGATAIRRIACDADLIAAVLDADGCPLDLARTKRLFDPALRRALVLRDRGCAFPGCTRPPAWCEGHHLVHWVDGGDTSLANGVLLCGHHHRVIHRGGWDARMGPRGRPEFLPPPYIDPDRTPRTNTVHLRN